MIEATLAFLFGLLIGSFLNVCVHRWPRGRSVVRPRSHCVRCRKIIAWYDNIPVVSYVLLGGKCRHCGRAISLRYPLVELLTGALFFYFVFTMGPRPEAIKMCVFAAMLVALVFSDLEKRILPDQFTVGGTVLGLALSPIIPPPDVSAQALLWLAGVKIPKGPMQGVAESVCGAFFPAFCLWFIGFVYERMKKKEALGLGDVKLMAMVGSFTGIGGSLFTLVLGSFAGSVIGYAYIKLARKDAAEYQLPFGTFLGLAALTAALIGQKVLGWYSSL